MRDFEEDFSSSSFACCHKNKIFIIRAFSAACGIKLWVKAEGWGIIYGILKRSVTFSVIHNEKRGINVHTQSASTRAAACADPSSDFLSLTFHRKKIHLFVSCWTVDVFAYKRAGNFDLFVVDIFHHLSYEKHFHAQMPSR